MSIFNELTPWKGKVLVDGEQFDTVENASASVGSKRNFSTIKLSHSVANEEAKQCQAEPTQYVFTVKEYMTRAGTPSFDFMIRWNNNIPMPLRVMVGTIEKETAGMVYANLHGEIITRETQFCMKCGKEITNPISRLFGLGPVCGGHNYVNPFSSDEELNAAVEKYRTERLHNITWSGWIIKSAIIAKEILY